MIKWRLEFGVRVCTMQCVCRFVHDFWFVWISICWGYASILSAFIVFCHSCYQANVVLVSVYTIIVVERFNSNEREFESRVLRSFSYARLVRQVHWYWMCSTEISCFDWTHKKVQRDENEKEWGKRKRQNLYRKNIY